MTSHDITFNINILIQNHQHFYAKAKRKKLKFKPVLHFNVEKQCTKNSILHVFA